MDDDANPHYWIGRTAVAIGQVLRHPDEADQILRPLGRDLAASGVIADRDTRRELIRDLERKPK